MTNDIVTLDIETENTGYDIMNDNKRIISVQILNKNEPKIYYDGSKSSSLDQAKKDLQTLIEDEKSFVGFNLKGFDIPLIKKFLDIEIPSPQIIEIGEMKKMNDVRQKLGKNRPRLAEICDLLGIDCSHKTLMDQQALDFKKLPEVVQKAEEGAKKWTTELGWGYDFSRRLALDRIAGGMAIFEAFNEFVRTNGDENSLFYKYAMGDVFSENDLYKKLRESSTI